MDRAEGGGDMATVDMTSADPNGSGRRGGNGAGPTPGPRQVGRRRPVVTQRALLGGLLVTLSALGVLWALTRDSEPPTADYLVVPTDLSAGQIVGLDDFEVRSYTLPDEVDRSTLFRSSRREPDARWMVNIDVSEGTLALVDDFRQLDAGAVPAAAGWPVTIELPSTHALNGNVISGMTVDLLVTTGSEGDAETTRVARNAEVVEVSPLGDNGALAVQLRFDRYETVLAAVNAGRAGELTLIDVSNRPSPTGPAESNAPNGSSSDR